MLSRIGFLGLFLLLSGCKTTQKSGSQLSSVDSHELFRSRIDDIETYKGLSRDNSGLVQGGRTLKFLIDYRNPQQASIYFLNSNFDGRCRTAEAADCARYHFYFAREALGIPLSLSAFNQATYFSQEKDFFAGVLNTYNLQDRGQVFGVQLYPQDQANEDRLLTLTRIVRSAFGVAGVPLAFVATGDQQTTASIRDRLAEDQILNLSLNSILGGLNYIPLHQGEAWGHLRLFPQNQEDLLPTDIALFQDLPLDLSVVAGTVTRAYQDSNSHINLKSKERNTPNMVLRDARPDHPQLKEWVNRPVHLKVSAQSWSLQASTDEEVRLKNQSKLQKPWTPLRWKRADAPVSFASMCSGRPNGCLQASELYGSKGANLGFLKEIFRDRTVPQVAPLSYDPVPLGLAVPLQFYRNFVDLPANAAVKSKLDSFIQREKSGLISAHERAVAAAELRDMMLNAELPQQDLNQILALAKQLAPAIDKWKIRSSANAEDIEGFDGAGLHDSYSAKVSNQDDASHHCNLVPDDDTVAGEVTKVKVKPKTFACAIKGVYASLWNKRAIEERSFARIDHASIAMGLAILPSYDTEAPVIANSVVVTRVLNSREIYGYTLSIQKDNNTVTNPAPGSWSEQTIFGFLGDREPSSLTTLRYAKPTPQDALMSTNVLPKETTLLMAALTRKVEEAYCRAREQLYYPGDCTRVAWDSEKPKALDLEMKYLQNGQFVIKQVREFAGY